MSGYRNPLDIISADYDLPHGYDSWGIKSVGFDGRTKYGFEWPAPGGETARYGLDDHESSCPRREGDGLCVATTWRGMASGGYRALCLLLVAYRASEARGDEPGKLRVPQVAVVARIDGEQFIRQADLSRANLSGAALSGANLWGANLWDANLSGANLSRANLRRANLSGAALSGANLWGANLWDANLSGANLSRANLSGAALWDANLRRANLSDANFRNADLPASWTVEMVRERGGIA
ncbi:pentapeptide repeat-containing protein [Microbacterium sp. No. 7]|uniref:pentapeptide repeat-containing protein n=1 Tax=Microbacterium sp. No. 7 TaxID=1714373 RepID=UPI0006ED26B1|nr:pentapeptide repeat-containing protein [Microbacterium sp. No. 7]ALJ19521.1 hypothetical protein AOA12_06205 [Microbacterium sp. No. 7]